MTVDGIVTVLGLIVLATVIVIGFRAQRRVPSSGRDHTQDVGITPGHGQDHSHDGSPN